MGRRLLNLDDPSAAAALVISPTGPHVYGCSGVEQDALKARDFVFALEAGNAFGRLGHRSIRVAWRTYATEDPSQSFSNDS